MKTPEEIEEFKVGLKNLLKEEFEECSNLDGFLYKNTSFPVYVYVTGTEFHTLQRILTVVMYGEHDCFSIVPEMLPENLTIKSYLINYAILTADCEEVVLRPVSVMIEMEE